MIDDKVPREKSKTIELKKERRYWFVFLVLTCLYFSEVFLKGAVLAIGDGFDYFYPMMITMSRQYEDFTFPFWNPQMFSGFPLFGSIQPGANQRVRLNLFLFTGESRPIPCFRFIKTLSRCRGLIPFSG